MQNGFVVLTPMSRVWRTQKDTSIRRDKFENSTITGLGYQPFICSTRQPPDQCCLKRNKFQLPPRKILIPSLVAEIENAFRKCNASTDEIQRTRMKIVGSLNRRTHLSPNLSPTERKAIKQLRDNKNILILPADKGKKTVLMNTSVYERKMMTLLMCIRS